MAGEDSAGKSYVGCAALLKRPNVSSRPRPPRGIGAQIVAIFIIGSSRAAWPGHSGRVREAPSIQ